MIAGNSVLRLVGSASALVAVRVAGMACGLLTMALLTRVLAPAAYGQVVFAQSLALIGALVCSLNLGATAIRFVPTYREAGDQQRLGSYLALARRSSLGLWMLCWLALALWLSVRADSADVATIPAWWFGLAAAPVLARIRLESAFVHALGRSVLASVPALLLRPVVLLALLGLSLLFSTSTGVSMVMILILGAAVLTLLLQRSLYRNVPLLCQPMVPGQQIRDTATPDTRHWFAKAGELLLPVLFLEFAIDTIVILSALVLHSAHVAALGVILRIQACILFGVSSINMAAAPMLASAQAAGDCRRRDRLLRLSAHLKLWPSALMLLSVAFIGEQVLSVFGTHYAQYHGTLLVLCVVPLVLSVFGPTVLFLTVLDVRARGHRIFALAFLALLILVPALGSVAGIDGVALAVLMVWLGWNLALHRLIRITGGFSTTPFAIWERGRT